jgi:hypothetical protein
MGELHDQFSQTGATLIGEVPRSQTIECIDSRSIQGDNFVGLALDEDNFYDESDGRIEKWVAQLKSEGAAGLETQTRRRKHRLKKTQSH